MAENLTTTSTTKKAAGRPTRPAGQADGETALLATIAAMPGAERATPSRRPAQVLGS